MPVDLSFTSDGLGVVSLYTGDVTDADLMAACEYRVQHIKQMADIRYNIADIRHATSVDLTTSGIMAVARKARESVMPNIEDLLYIAIVDSDDQYGTMRMWMTLSDHENINNQIAHSDESVRTRIENHLAKLEIQSEISWPED